MPTTENAANDFVSLRTVFVVKLRRRLDGGNNNREGGEERRILNTGRELFFLPT